MSLCLITPRLPPAIDGLGNYCRQLWHHICAEPIASKSFSNDIDNQVVLERLAEIEGQPWTFLVLDGAEASARIWPQVKIRDFAASQDSLLLALRATNPETVILQYVGYGFADNGSPLWLAAAFRDWKQQNPKARLFVMFHETWSSGQPWQKVFWQMSTQKKCVKQILEVSDAAVTSTRANAASLEVLGAATPISIIPIGSSFITQPMQNKDYRQLLIFGKEASRKRALNAHKELIKELATGKLVDYVVLAGQCTDDEADEISLLRSLLGLGIEIITCFNYPSDAIPDPVRTCGLALMHTQSTHLLKSTAFQLAVQLEQVAICRSESPADPPLVDGEHYLMYEPALLNEILDRLSNQQKLLGISHNCTYLNDELLSWPHIASRWCKLITT